MMIIKEIKLPIQNVLFWTDSTSVLPYLRNQRHCFKVYVANKVTEILEMMSASQWHHIGSKDNPADICSRGVATVHKSSNETGSLKSWYKGPNFFWSNSKVETKLKGSKTEDVDENNEEIKTKCFTSKICKVEPFIKFRIYSSWKRFCHILSYVKIFIKNCKTELKKLVGALAVHKIKGAQQDLIKLILQECFAEEYELLKTK